EAVDFETLYLKVSDFLLENANKVEAPEEPETEAAESEAAAGESAAETEAAESEAAEETKAAQ
ncbi:MAG: hypothetical protein IKH70_02415, partial [Stomatobaculum sp.]|nr:hypothetical protein [Stomatobaculum sp.]